MGEAAARVITYCVCVLSLIHDGLLVCVWD
eukprot:COSAG06_NODE_42335_length_382_cov_2.399293_1_plen_29_part_01